MKELFLESKIRIEELLNKKETSMSKEEYKIYQRKYIDLINLGRSEYKKDY